MPRLDYQAPGIYIEEVDRGSRPIEGVGTAVAGFVGFTEHVNLDKGAEPFKPLLITNWTQYREYFALPNSDGFTSFDAYLPFAVYGFFLNGGGKCWVTSIGTQLPESSPTSALQPTILEIPGRGDRPSLRVRPRANQLDVGPIQVLIGRGTPPPAAEGEEAPSDTGEYFSLQVRRGNEVLETYQNLTMNPEASTYVVTALRTSQTIEVEDVAAPGIALARRPNVSNYTLSPPVQASSPNRFFQDVQGLQDDRTGVSGLFEIDDVTMVACPDLMKAYQTNLMSLEQVHGIMELMVSMCEPGGENPNPPNRMVVLDPPPDRVKPQEVKAWLDDWGRRSMFAALYYPWIKVPNPRNNGIPLAIPPCGHVMGVWARTDETRGVYKAPANEVPRGVVGLTYETNFREQEVLNPVGINCISKFPQQGIRVWGARTLVEPDRTEWRYISVRRLISYIEKSIELGTRWAVFEPNDEDLWSRVRRTISNFLERLWREGALFGETPDRAFYVKCDAELNPPETMILGRLYIEVGICPVRPAEFVIIRISQWDPTQEGS